MLSGILALLSLAAVGCLAENEGLILNEVVDDILVQVKDELASSGQDVLPVQDVLKDWKVKKGFMRLKGKLSCTEGQVGHLTTIHRTGDTILVPEGDRLLLKMKLGIEKLFIEFKECEATVKNLWNFSSRMKAKVKDTSINGQISLVKEGDACMVQVDKIELDHMGDIDIEIGRSSFQRVINKLLELLTEAFRHNISKSISRKLEDLVKRKLPKADLCSKLPF